MTSRFKPLMTALICFWLLGMVFHVKPGAFSDGRRYVIYDQGWQRVGHLVQDDLRPGTYRVYDKDWGRRGYVKKKGRGFEVEK